MKGRDDDRNQQLYELLGAPSLLYRHAPSYNEVSARRATEPTVPPSLVPQEARQLHRTHVAVNRVRARWYYSMDHPFRPKYNQHKDETSKNKKRVRRPRKERHFDEKSKRKALLQRLNDADPFQQEPFLYSSSRDLEAARHSMLPPNDNVYENDYDSRNLRVQHIYDQPYVPGYATQRGGKVKIKLPESRLSMSRQMAKERHDAHVDYLAPVTIDSIRYALQEENQTADFRRDKTQREEGGVAPSSTSLPHSEEEDAASLYGNCLLSVPCVCKHCRSSLKMTNDKNEREESTAPRCRWCLIHPAGEMLSKVRISRLVFPHGDTCNVAREWESKHGRNNHELDVDEPIRQIEQCGKWGTGDNFGEDQEVVGMLVARSTSYCTLVSVRSPSREDGESTPSRQERVDQTKEVREASSVAEGCCSGRYSMKEAARVDLRSWYPSEPSFRPLDVTCHPNYGGAIVDAKFAILSSSSRTNEDNTIHHVTVGDYSSEPCISQHNVSCLKSISKIDFTKSHAMTLWASARCYVRPALIRRKRFKTSRPMLGHGNALYTIDLRTNDAVFQWSPSAEECLPEGIHSVCGIRTDWQRPHSVWVTSSSAAKMYEIDGRMTCRALNSWSLASACDDWGATLPRTGLFGSGTLLTQPQGLSLLMLSVGKRPGAFGVHLYQRPSALPRFQTRSLESVAGTGISSPATGLAASIGTSSIFALPDVSDTTFTCGLAGLQTTVTNVLQNVSCLGYRNPPTNALCVVTMTNKGDLYAHNLLECNPDTGVKAQSFPGLPLSCTAVPIPEEELQSSTSTKFRTTRTHHGAKHKGGVATSKLKLNLSNTFPISSDAITPFTAMKRGNCRPFKTIRLEDLPTIPVDRDDDKNSGEKSVKTTTAEKQVLVDHPMCGLGSVSTSPGVSNEVKMDPKSLQLPSCFVDAAHRDLRSFGDRFEQENDEIVPCSGHVVPRSDMTPGVLTAIETLWNDQDEIGNYVAVKKEETTETDK